MLLVTEPESGRTLPRGVILPEKDVPILVAAIQARATHLLAGDKRHFGLLFGTSVNGVLILPPAAYLAERARPEPTRGDHPAS